MGKNQQSVKSFSKKNKGKSVRGQKILEAVRQSSQNIGSFFVMLYLVLMAVWFPFFLTWGYRQAGTDKSMLFRWLGLGLLISVLPCMLIYWFCQWKGQGKKKFFDNICDSDKFVFAFAFVVLVSYMCSENREEALWGTKGWFIGFVTLMIYIASYLFISRFLEGKLILIPMFAASSSVSYVLGILNRFSVYPFELEGANPGFISTLGNINWFCGYWSVFFPMAVGLFYCGYRMRLGYRIFTGVYLMLATMAGAVQGSDSALLVFGAVTLVLFCVSGIGKKQRMAFLETIALLCACCQLIRVVRVIFPDAMNYDSASADLLTGGNATLFVLVVVVIYWLILRFLSKEDAKFARYFNVERFAVLSVLVIVFCIFVGLIIQNTLNPGSIGRLSGISAFTFNNKWGSSRGATWTAGLKVFDDMSFGRKLVGLGPDCFAYGVYKEGSSAIEIVKETFGNSRLTNAHNEWITVLVNMGLLGLFSYMGMFFSKAGRFIKKAETSPFAFACGLSLVGYMSNNLFSFQQVLNSPFIFIMMGIGEAIIRGKKQDYF